jgi:hypothetical protein
MITGMDNLSQNALRSNDLYLLEMWLTVDTVDWTTNTSAPASCAMAENRSAFCGIELTAAMTPPAFNSRTRCAIKSSLIGCV